MKNLSNAAILEIDDLLAKARRLARGNASDRAEASVLQQQAKIVQRNEMSTTEAATRYTGALVEHLSPKQVTEARYNKAFEKYVMEGDQDHSTTEWRDLLSGSQSISYTQDASGGALVPLLQIPTVNEGASQADPVVSSDVTDYVMEKSETLQPAIISGYDLSTISASLISEAVQQVGGVFPAVSGGKILRGDRIFKTSFLVSLEAEQDVSGAVSKICRAMGVSFGRALGADAVSHLLPVLPSPSVTTASGLITANNLLDCFFALNRFYRVQAKTSWLCNDWVYTKIRKAVDSQNRPLISIENGTETLLGRPLYVSPTFPGGSSPAVSGTLAFGDFSHWHLRSSMPSLRRSINSANTVEYGKILMIGRIRFDSLFLDESNGAFPPVVTCSVTP